MVDGKRLVTAAGVALAGVLAAAAAPRPAGGEGPDEGWTIEIEEVAPHASLALDAIPEAESLDCAECHADVVDEWASSQHAHAWIDPAFQEMLKTKRRPESCTGCHIPVRLLGGDPARFGRKPKPREDALEPIVHGISCRSCHEGPDGAMHGPFPTEGDGAVSADGHANVQDERFIGGGSDQLCASCHQTTVGPVIGVGKDYALARLGDLGMSCVDCHMRPVERAIATGPDGKTYPVREGRSHRLQTPRDPAFLASGFELGAMRADATAVLRILNQAGHRIPGLVDRRIVFEVEARDAGGAALASATHTIDAKAYLPVLESVDVRLEAPGATVLHVIGRHFPPSHGEEAEPIVFVDRSIPIP